jgi:hypothetical protein
MSSDLPETGFTSSIEMARVLSTYMDDANAIRSRILEDFDRAPAHRTIEYMRAEHLRPKAVEPPFKPHEGYYPDEVSNDAAAASKLFLYRLRRAYPERFAW